MLVSGSASARPGMGGMLACVPRLRNSFSAASRRVPPAFSATSTVFGATSRAVSHDEFGARRLVALEMQGDEAVDHLALALQNLLHVDRNRAGR